MAIVFSYRSGDANSFDARYAGGRKAGLTFGTGVSNAVDAGAIGGRSVQYTSPANWQAVEWSAEANTPNNRSISVVMRYAPNYNGAPAGRRALWGIQASGGTSAPNLLQLYHDLTTGALVIHSINELGTTAINFSSFGNWTTNVSGTWYDIVFTWDGTTSANAVKLYIDGVAFGSTLTASAALTASWTNMYRKVISVGVTATGTASSGKLNELVILDSVIDPTANVNLESGAGLLNGASRTSLMSDIAGATLTSFEGANSTNPGIGNVTNGTSYVINGVSYTGTLVSSGGGSTFIDEGVYIMGQPVTKINAFGVNADVDAGTEDVDSAGGTINIPTSAAATNIISSSANDAAAGTGARTCRVIGIDTNYKKLVETVTLNGTTQVVLTGTYLRINSVEVLTAGSGAANAGTIQVRHSTTVLATVTIGKNRSQAALFTPWANLNSWVITKIYSSLIAGTALTASFELKTRKAGGVWQTRWTSAEGGSLSAPINVDAGEDIIMTCTSTAANNSVTAGFDLIGSSTPL